MPRTRDPRPRARRILAKLRSSPKGFAIRADADKATVDSSLCSLISEWDKGEETRARIYAWNLKDPQHARKRKKRA